VVVLDGVWQHVGEEALHGEVSHSYIMRYKAMKKGARGLSVADWNSKKARA
jgi:hypothetical protein